MPDPSQENLVSGYQPVDQLKPPLQLRLLGAFSLRVQEEEVLGLFRPVQWLLALLVLRRTTPLSREWLAETLWPEATQERSAFYLRRSLTELRTALGSERSRLLSPTRSTLQFDFTNAFCDVVTFDALAARKDIASLEESIFVYRGDLLADCGAGWALLEREQRRECYIVALETLANQQVKDGGIVEAIRLLRRVTETDPLRQSAHCRLMNCLAEMGDSVGVERQFRILQRALHAELNLHPTPETVALYQQLMLASRVRQSVPASPALKRRLPRPLTMLIGHKASIGEIGRLLCTERLITLTGTGGIGKTRLALAVGEAVSEHWTDGVWWGNLASLAEPRHIVPALLRAFGQDDSGSASPLDALKGFLRERHTLLILDNCEHLVTACAALCADLLGECEQLHILATSREPLNIVGEMVWRVPALTVPTLPRTAASFEAESVCISEAAQLFAARAQSAHRDFRITAENSDSVAHICRTLDGIPLALELAAVWVRSLSVEQIAGRLQDSFMLLAHGNRFAPLRHQTLQTLIEWSEALLDRKERELLAQLAVFAGGWTLEAAEAVCGSETIGREAIALLLNRLAEQSLVEVERNGGEARYRFLETVRQFAAARLQECGGAIRLRERHRNYFLILAETLCSRLGKADSASLLDHLEQERDNFRAAFASCRADNDSTDLELRLATHLHRFFSIRGNLSEGIQVLKSGLERGSASPSVRAEGLLALGQLHYRMEENTVSMGLLEEALATFREQALPQREAEVLRQLGTVLVALDNYNRARTYLKEALDLSRHIGNRYEEARSTASLGNIAKSEGDTKNAILLFGRANQILDEMGEFEANGIVLHNWGNALREQGDWRSARSFYERSLTIHRQLDKRTWIGFNLYELALCCLKERDVAQARLLFEEMSPFSQNVGDQAANYYYLVANISLQENRLEQARKYLLQAVTIGHRLGMYRGLTYCFWTAADIALAERNREMAVRFLSIALQQREAIQAPLAEGERHELEETLARLRYDLGVAAFETELQVGKDLDSEDALLVLRTFCTLG